MAEGARMAGAPSRQGSVSGSSPPPVHVAAPALGLRHEAVDPVVLIRRALGADEQVIRVSDHLTRETFDVMLSRSTPYAAPVPTRAVDARAGGKSGGADPPALVATPPPSRRRRPRWMRSTDDDVETPPDYLDHRPGLGAFLWHPDARSPPPSRGDSPGVPGPTPSYGRSPVPSPGLSPSSWAASPAQRLASDHPAWTAAAPSSSPPSSPPRLASPRAPTTVFPRESAPGLSHMPMLGAPVRTPMDELLYAASRPVDDAPATPAPATPAPAAPVAAAPQRDSADVSGSQMWHEAASEVSATSAPDATQSVAPLRAAAPVVLPPHAEEPAAAERTFDEEMAQRADEMRRSWRTQRVGHGGGTAAANAAASDGAVVLTSASSNEGAPRVQKGRLIGEDHVNYVLMYHMLTGIRIAVSRCEARPVAPLTNADFTSRYKFTFDIIGNELAPTATYDFKFKDYAPAVFRELRHHFGLDAGDYLLSLAARYILTELGSPGKSGSFFYFSHDYRFIIKTIRHAEHKLFLRILPQYYEHVRANPQTLLSQFYGLHRVKLPGRRKIHFVIMNNLFPPDRDVQEVYDLKGSTVLREQTSPNPSAVLKDTNWLKRGRKLQLGPQKRAWLEAQLKKDVALLQRLRLMDYSLLIGVCDASTDARPVSQPMLRRPSVLIKPADVDAPDTRRTSERDATLTMALDALPLASAVDRPEKRTSIGPMLFYVDEGGFRATDAHDQPLGIIYYLGIIDIFTQYDAVKRSEHWWKGLRHNRHAISSVPPVEYGERFVRFLLRSPS